MGEIESERLSNTDECLSYSGHLVITDMKVPLYLHSPFLPNKIDVGEDSESLSGEAVRSEQFGMLGLELYTIS